MPELPEVPDEPDEPLVPFTPDEPEVPEVPLIPDVPDEPLVPEEPSPPLAPSKLTVQEVYVPEPTVLFGAANVNNPVPELYVITSHSWKLVVLNTTIID